MSKNIEKRIKKLEIIADEFLKDKRKDIGRELTLNNTWNENQCRDFIWSGIVPEDMSKGMMPYFLRNYIEDFGDGFKNGYQDTAKNVGYAYDAYLDELYTIGDKNRGKSYDVLLIDKDVSEVLVEDLYRPMLFDRKGILLRYEFNNNVSEDEIKDIAKSAYENPTFKDIHWS